MTVLCPTYGSMSRQRCVDNQLSIFNLWDFCDTCQEGVRVELPSGGAERSGDSAPASLTRRYEQGGGPGLGADLEKELHMGPLGTKNMSPEEYRCKCCGQLPPQWRDGEVPPLLLADQKLRDRIGRPLHITPHGGYRCPRQNKISDGAGHSQHLLGKASDKWVEGMTPAKLAAEMEQISEFRRGGIGIYPNFTHGDIRDNGPARWEG
jgi:hypothetical protein